MTTGEEARAREDLKCLQVAITKVVRGTAMESIYAAMAMTLGAVLGDPVYEQNFRKIMDEIRRFGVNPTVSSPR